MFIDCSVLLGRCLVLFLIDVVFEASRRDLLEITVKRDFVADRQIFHEILERRFTAWLQTGWPTVSLADQGKVRNSVFARLLLADTNPARIATRVRRLGGVGWGQHALVRLGSNTIWICRYINLLPVAPGDLTEALMAILYDLNNVFAFFLAGARMSLLNQRPEMPVPQFINQTPSTWGHTQQSSFIRDYQGGEFLSQWVCERLRGWYQGCLERWLHMSKREWLASCIAGLSASAWFEDVRNSWVADMRKRHRGIPTAPYAGEHFPWIDRKKSDES